MMREPRRHLFSAWAKEIVKRVRAKLIVLLCGLNHLLERRLNKQRTKGSAYLPIIPSQETTNGVKCRLCSRQEVRHFRFFVASTVLMMVEGFLADKMVD